MNDIYVKADGIYKKIKMAESKKQHLYISAPVGYGKTAALKAYFKNKKVLWLWVEDGKLSQIPIMERIEEPIVIIDNFSLITDEKSKEYIKQLLQIENHVVIMSSRTKVPEWLKLECVKQHFLLAYENEFLLTTAGVKKLLESYQVKTSAEEIKKIYEDTKGCPLPIIMAAYRMQQGALYTEQIQNKIKEDVCHYYQEAFFNQLPLDMRKLFLQLIFFDSFTPDMAEYVTENEDVVWMLKTASHEDEVVVEHEDGTYGFHEWAKNFLIWKAHYKKDRTLQKHLFIRAAEYYKTQNQMQLALEYYEMAGAYHEISDVLIENSKMHPGIGFYYELKKYYFNLPKEELLQSSVLMTGISMLYSMLLQPEKSEYWYQNLVEYKNKPELGEEERKEAAIQIGYLDLALLHRDTSKIPMIIKKMAIEIMDNYWEMPEISISSSLPSFMNGAKDYSDWSKADKELAKSLRKSVDLINRNTGAGLLSISLAESLFEKGKTDYYEIMTLLNNGYSQADVNGNIETCFVAAALLAQIHVQKKQLGLAKKQLMDFEKKLKGQNKNRIIANLHALLAWFSIIEGNKEEVQNWVEIEAPNENVEFYAMERFRYMIKVRAYLFLGRNEEALGLIERLDYYIELYHRTYMSMQIDLLRAIAQYRLGNETWKHTMTKVLPRIEEYHFLNMIRREGIAIRKLLMELKKLPVSRSFEEEIFKSVTDMAAAYPKYLECEKGLEESLTEMEQKVLHLYCEGLSPEQICDFCNFTYNTLKYHNRNLYRKLGVGNRIDAERKAKDLRLCERY